MVLFDPTNRQDTLKGVEFWLGQLSGKNNLPPSILIGTKADRGEPILSRQELDQFCQHRGISGGYISISAMNGQGIYDLIKVMNAQIKWEKMTTTVTTTTFKRIKEYVLSLKEKPDRKDVLVSPSELRLQLEASDKNWHFADAEMMTAVGHLENHGYITILKSSAGDKYLLLAPDLLVDLASSIVLLADKNPRELGAISETELLQGKYKFEELDGLEELEQRILLDAAILLFLGHSICFRETYGNDTLLIFPGLIKQKRPLKDDIPSTDDTSYIVRGRIENIYPMLVVLLGYTSSFTRINQWQNQAQYETNDGKVCGFRMIEEREGEIELILYYGNDLPVKERSSFQELFELFLYKREVQVARFTPVMCQQGHRQERSTVVKCQREGRQFVFCYECGEKVDLPRRDISQTTGISISSWLQKQEAGARLRNTYEAHLSSVKGYRREWAVPRCYISRIPEQTKLVEKLVHDLSDAGIYLIEKSSEVQKEDYVIVLDTPEYQHAWKNKEKSLEEDIKLIQARLAGGKYKLCSVVFGGEVSSNRHHNINNCRPGDFSDETHYPLSLFNLVLDLYAIPFNHAGFAPKRQSLHQQWEDDFSKEGEEDMKRPLKIFISYSHRDEEFKDDLVTMLAGLQRHGIIDAWQDRRIEEGDEWYQEIKKAMTNCDLAMLLISSNFIASRFIQDEELPKLFKRRMDEGLRVVPIIVRDCMWQSEPILKDIQALPRDGKPIITFPKENGERDTAWRNIAQAIERYANM